MPRKSQIRLTALSTIANASCIVNRPGRYGTHDDIRAQLRPNSFRFFAPYPPATICSLY